MSTFIEYLGRHIRQPNGQCNNIVECVLMNTYICNMIMCINIYSCLLIVTFWNIPVVETGLTGIPRQLVAYQFGFEQ